jgi:hypothetical protein
MLKHLKASYRIKKSRNCWLHRIHQPAFANEAIATPLPCLQLQLYFVLFVGYIICETQSPDLHYKGQEVAWGLGGAVSASGGVLYTTYDRWEGLWDNTVAYHAQGIAEGGGFLQITWFNSQALPTGQFNAVAGGISAFEVGGSWHWNKV